MKLIAQGAEAKIFQDDSIIIKERVSKTYRIKELDDKIRKQRTRREVSILERAYKLIPVPKLISHSEKDYKIKMELIKGKKLADTLDNFQQPIRLKICKKIGEQIAILHNNNIIHGDLTTSNMILTSDSLYFIDFGLSFIDQRIEHKAVDLHLIKQALESKHYRHFESSFKAVLEGYKSQSNSFKEVILQLEKVEGRGRYKSRNKKT
jgi:TP53 regulating kinase-like protein